MLRTRPRHTRLLACAAAAIPVVLLAGCSSDSGDGGSAESSKSATAEASPTVAPAKYRTLPKPCKTVSEDTIEKIVPKAKAKSGTPGRSSDLSTRSTCSWHGLDGYQYRWLDVSLQRFDSDPTLGSGAERAKDFFTKQVDSIEGTAGAKNLATGKAAGVGDAATTVRYDLKKGHDQFKNQTVVVRTANVVITLNYNGAGYEDGKTPDAKKLLQGAETAAKQVVSAVDRMSK